MAGGRLSDDERKRWAFRRQMAEEVTQEHRDWEASLPDLPPSKKRINGELVDENYVAPTEPIIEGTTAVEWYVSEHGKTPTPVNSLMKAAIKHKYDVLISHTWGERRGSHGRLLDPNAGTYCTVMARRGDEGFMATWCKPDGKDKWAFTEGLDFSPDALPARPKIYTKITKLKEARLT